MNAGAPADGAENDKTLLATIAKAPVMTPVTLIITDDIKIANALCDGRPMGINWTDDDNEVIVPARVIRFVKGDVSEISFDLPDDLSTLVRDEVEDGALAAAIETARHASS